KLADALSDAPAVHGLQRNRLQDQQVQRTLDQIVRLAHQPLLSINDKTLDFLLSIVNRRNRDIGLEPWGKVSWLLGTRTVWRRLDLYALRNKYAIVILSAEREESRGFSPVAVSVGILHPLKRVQNDKGTRCVARKNETIPIPSIAAAVWRQSNKHP